MVGAVLVHDRQPLDAVFLRAGLVDIDDTGVEIAFFARQALVDRVGDDVGDAAPVGLVGEELLADELPAALRVGWALVVEVTADARCRLIARGESAPMWEGGEVSVLCGLERVTALDDDDDGVPAEWTAMDTSLAAAPLNSGHILVVGRPGGPSFRPSEVARLGYLTGILRSLDAG